MKKLFSFLLLILALSVGVNTCFAKSVEQKSLLEVRNIQTRYYETTDTVKVAKAVINTLQDNGFIIQNIEPELGYIRAKKESREKRTDRGRVTLYSTFLGLNTAALAICFGANPFAIVNICEDTRMICNEIAPHPVIFDSNVDIEKVGNRTKVRFTVIEKELENADGLTTVKPAPRRVVRHYESELYQEFFSQVDKNLFLEGI